MLRLSSPPLVTVAGRTDAGVHARGQVAHVDVPTAAWLGLLGRSERTPGRALVDRLAAVAPAELAVRRAGLAPDGFDARFSALWRRYAYRVADDPALRDPLRRFDVLWHRRPLDLAAMAAAGERLTGEHDFAAFCRPRPGATTIRTLLELRWEREPDGVAVAHARADAFCHSMVRALVGACLAVGEGRRAVDWPAEVLAAGARDSAVTVAPAHGLTLEEVRYPPAAALSHRAREARRVRTAALSGPTADATERG